MKDKTAEISKRDRQLLSILVALVILFICYYFVASPALDQGGIVVEQLQTAEAELQKAQELVVQGPNLKRDVARMKEELTLKYATFLYNINEPRILHQMDGLMTTSGFVIESYTQSEHIVSKLVLPASAYMPPMYPLLELAKKLNPLVVKEVVLSEVEPTSQGSVDSVEQIDIGIGFSGVAYDALYRFIQGLEATERSFIVSDIVIENDIQEPGLSGQLVVRAISLPKLDPDEATDLTFTPALPQGKATPF
jgi:hypothetical protein